MRRVRHALQDLSKQYAQDRRAVLHFLRPLERGALVLDAQQFALDGDLLLTQDARYGERAHAILAYYCGANPLQARILSEIGSINNRITDKDNDGIEDELSWDAYPESTAFVQIGLLRLLSQ